jgi:hypothetical protein
MVLQKEVFQFVEQLGIFQDNKIVLSLLKLTNNKIYDNNNCNCPISFMATRCSDILYSWRIYSYFASNSSNYDFNSTNKRRKNILIRSKNIKV